MMDLILFWYSVIFVIVFWGLLAWRFILLKKMNLEVVKIPKLLFLSVFILWSVLFIIYPVISLDFFIVDLWWKITDFPLIVFLLQILGGIFQAIMWMGVITMGKSWRIGIDNDDPGKLVTKGIFKVSRNPIFFGLDGILLVSLCLYPNLFNLIFTLGSIIGIHIQILREEKHLSNIYGEEYKKYKKNVERYFLII